MKIGQLYGNNYAGGIYKINDERKNGCVEGKTVNKSTVEISSQAKALVKRISESEDTNFSEKVESIRRSIQSGTYTVDTGKLADKILEKIDAEKVQPNE